MWQRIKNWMARRRERDIPFDGLDSDAEANTCHFKQCSEPGVAYVTDTEGKNLAGPFCHAHLRAACALVAFKFGVVTHAESP